MSSFNALRSKMDGTTAWHLSKITYAVMSLEPTFLLNLLHCQTLVRRRAKCMSHVADQSVAGSNPSRLFSIKRLPQVDMLCFV